MVITLHFGTCHQVKQMKFDSVNLVISHTTSNVLNHHLVVFPWKTINQVRNNLNLRSQFTKTFHRFNVKVISVSTVNDFRSFIISGLQPKFNSHMHTLRQLSNVGNGFIWQTVGTCPDINPDNTRLVNRLFIAFSNHINRVVCIGEVLEINQVFLNFWPFTVHEIYFFIKLITNWSIWSHDSITRT